MNRIWHACITFLVTILVFFVDSKWGISQWASSVFPNSAQKGVTTATISFEIAIFVELFTILINHIRAKIDVFYLDKEKQKINDIRLVSESLMELVTKEIIVVFKIKYSPFSEWFFSKCDVRVVLSVNPLIASLDTSDSYMGHRNHMIHTQNGVEYSFIEDFTPSRKQTSINKNMVLQGEIEGNAEIKVNVISKFKFIKPILYCLCQLEAEEINIKSEVKY